MLTMISTKGKDSRLEELNRRRHDETMNMLIRDVPKDLQMAFKVRCVQEGISMNQKVIDLVREYVESKRTPAAKPAKG